MGKNLRGKELRLWKYKVCNRFLIIEDKFMVTLHTETICLLSRETCRQTKDYIKVGIDAEEYYAIKHANKE